MNANLYFFTLLHDLAGRYWPLDWLIIFLAAYLSPFLILAALIFSFRRPTFKSKFSVISLLLLSVLIAAILVIVFRLAIDSPRPFTVFGFKPLISQSPTPSFPSAHTTIFVSLASAIWFIDHKTGYRFLLGAFLIGVARIVAGVHWPVDIVGGLLFGFVSALLAYRILPHKEYLDIKTENKNQIPDSGILA